MKTIDWDYIKTQYPLAFKFFKETMFPNTKIVTSSVLKLYHIRNLYYFFDSLGIILTTESLNETQWIGTIQLRSGFSYSVNGSFTNRHDLEVESFRECFEQLNIRLNNLKLRK